MTEPRGPMNRHFTLRTAVAVLVIVTMAAVSHHYNQADRLSAGSSSAALVGPAPSASRSGGHR